MALAFKRSLSVESPQETSVSTSFSVAKRVVSQELQERFAALSGDRNPMHMDAVAARRTQAGLPVVHGIHTLLWALDSIAGQGLIEEPL